MTTLVGPLLRAWGLHIHPARPDKNSVDAMRETLASPFSVQPGLVAWLRAVAPPERGGHPLPVALEMLARPPRAPRAALSTYSPRTVARRLRAAGLPPPKKLRCLAKAAHFTIALQSPDLPSVEEVARSFGYGDGSYVSHLLNERIGVSTREVRACLGWRWIATRFLGIEGRVSQAAN